MSGLKNVLGNVYGDPNDRPQKANLDDVQESMDALVEHVDEDAPTSGDPEAVDTAHADAPASEAPDAESISDFGEWLDDGDAFNPSSDLPDDIAQNEVPVSEEDSPWAMLDELPDLHDNTASPVEASTDISTDTSTQPDIEAFADTEVFADLSVADVPATEELSATEDSTDSVSDAAGSGAAWLNEVDDDEAGEDWLNDYDDDSGWTGSTGDQDGATAAGETDELADFDFDAVDVDPSERNEPSVEDLMDGTIAEAAALSTSSVVQASDAPASTGGPQSDAENDLDPGQEAWLDDLFSLDPEDADAEATSEVAAVDSPPGLASEANASHASIGTGAGLEPVSGEPELTHGVSNTATAATPVTLDAVSAVYSAAEQNTARESEGAIAASTGAPEAGFHGGWARMDDDILPQKKSGGRRRQKKTDVAIAPDSRQLSHVRNPLDATEGQAFGIEDAEASNAQPGHAVPQAENALLGSSIDDALLGVDSLQTDFIGAPSLEGVPSFDTETAFETETSPATSDDRDLPSFDEPLLRSAEELDESDAVHLFAHDESLEDAATAGGRRKAKKAAVKAARAAKAEQAKAQKAAAKAEKAVAGQLVAPNNFADDPEQSNLEALGLDSAQGAAPKLDRKAKKAAAKTARAAKAEQAKAQKAAAKAEKAATKNNPKERKGRRGKNNDEDLDASLRAQVDAAIAAQVASNTDVDPDDFWADGAATPAAEVMPSPPAGMADPLGSELVSPPPPPNHGFDPGPVLD